jgi:hypothetical protein
LHGARSWSRHQLIDNTRCRYHIRGGKKPKDEQLNK